MQTSFFTKPPATLTIYLNRLKLHKHDLMHAFHSIRPTVELTVKFLNLCMKLERKKFKNCVFCNVRTTDEALVCH